jgi:general stress protein 26
MADPAREKLWQLIQKHRFAMLTTHEEGGVLRSRPMTTIDHDFDGSLWFFAKADSETVAAIGLREQVCLAYADSGAVEFVSVGGVASVVTDVEKKRALWNKGVQAWFPEGPDSDLNVLIRVDADHAEFWDSTASRLVRLFSLARALATDVPPRGMGEHRSVELGAAR